MLEYSFTITLIFYWVQGLFLPLGRNLKTNKKGDRRPLYLVDFKFQSRWSGVSLCFLLLVFAMTCGCVYAWFLVHLIFFRMAYIQYNGVIEYNCLLVLRVLLFLRVFYNCCLGILPLIFILKYVFENMNGTQGALNSFSIGIIGVFLLHYFLVYVCVYG